MGTVSLQGAINTFGSDIIVAHAAARKITMIFMLPFGVFGQALATFCGQNMGAGEYGRIRTGLRQTIFLTWGWCLLVILTANTISPQMITMITASRNENILLNGSMYLKFDTAFYFIPTLITLVRNSLQGVGDSLTPVISSFIEFAGKILISLFLAPAIGYWGIIVAEPIVWTLMVIPLLIALRRNRVFNENAPAKGAGRIL
jgi:Na+-driven multidrug efflux pump